MSLKRRVFLKAAGSVTFAIAAGAYFSTQSQPLVVRPAAKKILIGFRRKLPPGGAPQGASLAQQFSLADKETQVPIFVVDTPSKWERVRAGSSGINTESDAPVGIVKPEGSNEVCKFIRRRVA